MHMPSPGQYEGGYDEAKYEAYRAADRDEDITLFITLGGMAALALAGCIARKLHDKGR